ncbi:hypothetical protein AM571_PC00764 (plasmid) [Rhizobium etli 8C-3]|uniref:Uncharacterized protein n=1 Tax=Rhizobium etli 8C-3 TaxID=538025 RepID=A0A1L5PE63_RHIET|nr:hypothetical protein AM571_PC00764 [Rhizobium etli 8C-3]
MLHIVDPTLQAIGLIDDVSFKAFPFFSRVIPKTCDNPAVRHLQVAWNRHLPTACVPKLDPTRLDGLEQEPKLVRA